MSIDNLPEELVGFPNFIPSNFQRYNNMNNLNTAIRKINQLKKTGQSTVVHDPRTCNLVITCTIGNSMCRLTTSTIQNSSQVIIEYYCCEKQTHYEVQRFNSKELSGHLELFLLTPEDLEQKRAFEQQEQERKDALEKAHNSNPQMCDQNTCVHCSNDRLHDWCQPRKLGTYT
jgi:hypothetical protein